MTNGGKWICTTRRLIGDILDINHSIYGAPNQICTTIQSTTAKESQTCTASKTKNSFVVLSIIICCLEADFRQRLAAGLIYYLHDLWKTIGPINLDRRLYQPSQQLSVLRRSIFLRLKRSYSRDFGKSQKRSRPLRDLLISDAPAAWSDGSSLVLWLWYRFEQQHHPVSGTWKIWIDQEKVDRSRTAFFNSRYLPRAPASEHIYGLNNWGAGCNGIGLYSVVQLFLDCLVSFIDI